MASIGETTLEINLPALAHNYNFIKSKLDPSTKFLAVVKAFAYGSEMVAVAKKLEALGANYFAVAYTKEGVLLRDAGIKLPILVLHPQVVNFEELIDKQLEPSIYSSRILKSFLTTVLERKQSNYPIHLKFNTGLNRIGFNENDIANILEQLDNSTLKITSVFSHLAASEDKNERVFSLQQIATFKKISELLSAKLGYMPNRHMLNTSGILNYPEAQYDMVRSGIGLYGYGNHPTIDTQLQPVATLKTIISQIHTIEPKESIGYNRAYIAKEPKKTATLPIGHADGIARQYGNEKSFVFINGKKAPIIGNVCMDMIMVDVTDINCREGDEVIIFGANSSAETFANTANSISYEILTAISQRVYRKIIA